MNFYSTNSTNTKLPASEAIALGLPSDNGLFMPENIPVFEKSFFDNMKGFSLPELAFHVLKPYFHPEFSEETLKAICEETFNFPIPLVEVEENIFSLELYHGPTLAFKDVGARFLARCLNAISQKNKEKLTVLVATSGDTGSAVAHGFYGMDNVNVVILYPEGRISELQERQMTCLGKNITALKIKGNFDDCQALVKKAFLDKELNQKAHITSANSINVARFLPQSVYYYYGIAQLPENNKKVVVSVPSGNYGNMTAGLFANLTGLRIDQFIASSNANNIVPEYLKTGVYTPKPSVATISNAMDVGDPSNFKRMQRLFKLYPELKQKLSGFSYNDFETIDSISNVFQENNYMMDPHGAVGYRGLVDFIRQDNNVKGIFLETAHPVKFRETVEKAIEQPISIPEQLNEVLNKEKKFIFMENDYNQFSKLIENLK